MFQWLSKIFKSQVKDEKGSCISVKCLKCSQVLNMHIDFSTDLISGYSKNETPYKLHKETVCKNCSNAITIEIEYNRAYQPFEKNISGAKFIRKKT